jgi:hypothetical protein
MALTPTTTVVENGNVGILLIMGVDVYSIYISADGEIVPEFLAAIPSDYYTRDQVYNKTEVDVKLMDIDSKFDDFYVQDQVYNKTEVDVKLSLLDMKFADFCYREEVYIKPEIDDKLKDYYTKNLVYTRPEIDNKIADFASINYVQSLVGDINIVLDQINGEEI